MVLDRLGRDHQSPADLAVGYPSCGQVDHALFLRSQCARSPTAPATGHSEFLGGDALESNGTGGGENLEGLV